MKSLAGILAEWIEEEYGPEKLIERLADPLWFQAFALVLGFDWHSSGTTTTAIGALREGYKGEALHIIGGKGKLSREVSKLKEDFSERAVLPHALFSKALIDGYSIYFASAIHDGKRFVVIDQGMNDTLGYARRYHWYSEFSPYEEKENIAGLEDIALNTISKRSRRLRKAMVDAVNEGDILKVGADIKGIFKAASKDGVKQKTLLDYSKDDELVLSLPKRHWIRPTDLSKKDLTLFKALREYKPSSYDELLLFEGFGAKKVRALALIAKLVYGEEIDWKDPVKYSYAHGGKDGIPYPVNRGLYDANISLLREVLEDAKVKEGEKKKALRRLYTFTKKVEQQVEKQSRD